jgi:recombinational DNA repair protein (RecF pathway)
MLAVTLERRAFRDFDQLVTLYTKERGKVTVLARGSKKSTSKNASLLEPLFFS